MNELVTLTPTNPLNDIRREDGTWSARDVQGSNFVHTRWEHWEAAIQRGVKLVAFMYGGGETAAQNHFQPTVKMIQTGKGAQREVNDYALTPLGLYAACEQSRLPELDAWFVYAGLQAGGHVAVSQPVSQSVSTDPVAGLKYIGRSRSKRFGALKSYNTETGVAEFYPPVTAVPVLPPPVEPPYKELPPAPGAHWTPEAHVMYRLFNESVGQQWGLPFGTKITMEDIEQALLLLDPSSVRVIREFTGTAHQLPNELFFPARDTYLALRDAKFKDPDPKDKGYAR